MFAPGTTQVKASIDSRLWKALIRARDINSQYSFSAIEYGRGQAKAAQGIFKQYMGLSHRDATAAAMDMSAISDEPLLDGIPISDVLVGFVENKYDQKVARTEEHRGYDKRVKIEQRALEELLIRLHSQKLLTPLTSKVSIDALHNGRTASEWRLSNKLRHTYSKSTTQALCASHKGYQPPLRDNFEMCSQVRMAVQDNKEFMLNCTSRLENGQRKVSLLYHCVTGEELPIPASILKDVLPTPTDSIWLDQSEQVSLASKFPMPQVAVDAWLEAGWKTYVQIYLSTKDAQKLLERPDAADDKWEHGRQVSFHLPIHMDTGTSQLKDVRKVMDSLLARDADCFWIFGGDQQTVRNAWTIIWSDPEKYRRMIILPGGLHEMMHDCQATAQLGWSYHLEPVCLLTGSLKVHTAKFYAKEHNEKQRLILLTHACGIKYLCDTDIPEATLLMPTILMRTVKKNEALHDFIFWMFYCALPYRISLNATRTSDNDTKDNIWRYNMYKYAATKKTNYKLLCLMFGQVCVIACAHLICV